MFFLKQGWFHTNLKLQQEQKPSFHNLIARGQSTSDVLDIRADNLNPYREILLTGSSVSLLHILEAGSVTWAYWM